MLSLTTLAAILVIGVGLILNSILSRDPQHSIRIADLWKWKGTVDRRSYALVGFIGFAVKHNIDRMVATWFFGRRFTPMNYWIPPVKAIRVDLLSSEDARFLATMLAIALPFVWVGLAMTTRRLRSAGLPIWLNVLFFVPVLNLIFFLLLCLVPARWNSGSDPELLVKHGSDPEFGSLIPHDRLGSAAIAVTITGALGALVTYVGVEKLGTYGWSVFVALPFCFGLVSSLIYGYHEPRTLRSCMAVSAVSVAIVAVALMAFAVEGLICIVMALPIAMPLALLGGAIGYMAQRHSGTPREAPSAMLLVLLLPLGVMSTETIRPLEAPLVSVQTSIRIDAKPEVVWRNLVEFPDIVEPPSGIFRMGVSYPIRAAVHGDGVGALRECDFSTGTFVERIDVWEEGKRLAFSVVSGPESMREWSPYDIRPRHLNGYFMPDSADFRLTSNPDGSTQLDGISWYRNRMWPSSYWRLWSDALLHRVHSRVFEHIKSLSEHNP